jgi:FkbM family methyltransferase
MSRTRTPSWPRRADVSALDQLDEAALSKLAGINDIVIDVGAGQGAFSRAARDRGATVHAVDPSLTACDRLAGERSIIVHHGAAGERSGHTSYVERVGRVLTTNARDAVLVPVLSVDDLFGRDPARSLVLLRLRCRGSVAAALQGARSTLGEVAAVLIDGDTLVGDDAAEVLELLSGWTVWASTCVGPRLLSPRLARLQSGIRWIATPNAGARGPLPGAPAVNKVVAAPEANVTDLAAVAAAEARAVDPTARARIGRLLEEEPDLWSIREVADSLDELALDPDRATWRAVGWWRHDLAGLADRERSARRAEAFDRLLDRMTGERASRPAPFPVLN